MEYTEEILKRLLQELIDKREYFYSDEVVNNLLSVSISVLLIKNIKICG